METQLTVEKKGNGFKKAFRAIDMTLFTVAAILVIDTLAPSAAIGPSSISWWIITLVLFFIPYGLITAELGTTYPEQGGLYIWVRNAFGERWAARTTWLYWINVALWMPSVYVLFAGMFAQLFIPDLSLWGQIAIGVLMTWVTVVIGIVALDIGKWVPNVGALIKALIMLVIGFGAFFYAAQHGVANDLSFRNILPTWDAGLYFLPVIVYNFMGFELMSGAGEEMQNPQRDIPRAIITAGVLIAFFYLMGTIGMLMALPAEQLGLVSGIIDTLRILFGETGVGGVIVTILGIGALYTFLTNMVTWTMGANRTAAEAANEGELPAFFGKLHPINKTPVGAYVLTGIVSSAVLIIYGLMASTAEDLFWSLFAFSSIVFLLPYLAMFPAFLRLRRTDANRPRPYRVPGNHLTAILMTIICVLFILQAIVFFIWVPGEPVDWNYAIPVLVGVGVTLIIGEFIIQRK
ncbi:amino acid/polyamine/organocation transporter, APC superfamily [Bellilinea caldifistulae]|uniref:Amino acid permease n=1 Tax=Bellilinea caldifistulae TaxID=360411 RepID=A0A0P6XS63_9CHLR|nr:APC family permease [Bellilinea caldifistulae]KPL72469.1 amino acid permease [Bellilinea caldifistulae]GAP10823.1 amino acid/polyamine/organocation transporter, APC superfamily [Bellilinea caldifistulae]